jgi:hypothetical protein
MTFITPQQHINTTPRESCTDQTHQVLTGCLIAVVMLGTLVGANALWTGPVQSYIAHKVAAHE